MPSGRVSTPEETEFLLEPNSSFKDFSILMLTHPFFYAQLGVHHEISLSCLALGTAITLSACSTVPSKPKLSISFSQFSAYPLNAQTFRISFQADPNMSYGATEEITLVKSAQTTVQKVSAFKVLNDPSNQSQKPPRQAVVYPSASFTRMVTTAAIRVSGMIRSMISHKWSISTLFKCRILLNVIGIKSRLKMPLMQR